MLDNLFFHKFSGALWLVINCVVYHVLNRIISNYLFLDRYFLEYPYLFIVSYYSLVRYFLDPFLGFHFLNLPFIRDVNHLTFSRHIRRMWSVKLYPAGLAGRAVWQLIARGTISS